jgi:hypothetical protein
MERHLSACDTFFLCVGYACAPPPCARMPRPRVLTWMRRTFTGLGAKLTLSERQHLSRLFFLVSVKTLLDLSEFGERNIWILGSQFQEKGVVTKDKGAKYAALQPP